MRKFVSLLVVMLVLLGLPLGSAMAAAKIDLAIDGVVVPAEPTEENTTSFYLETRPNMRSNSVFVPVRVVSEILGAEVTWENPVINIKYEDTEIVLTVGSRTAYKDGQKMTLPAAPYVQGGYTYVPIRFVAEAFACDVDWQAKENLVNIKVKPWELNGRQIIGLAWLENMTGYDMTYEVYSPYFAQRLYQITLAALGEEVAAPADFGGLRAEHFGDDQYNTLHYWLDKTIYLLVDEDTAAAAVKFYNLDRGQAEHSNLVCIDDKWYVIEPEQINKLVGLFQVIEAPRLDYYKEYKLLGQAE